MNLYASAFGRCYLCQINPYRVLQTLGIFCFFMVVLVVAAAAQTVVPDTRVSLWSLLGPWVDGIGAALGALVLAVLGWLSVTIQRKTGIQIDFLRSETLQAAITNGAGKLVMLLGDRLKDVSIDVKSAAVKEAVEYVFKAAPDAIAHFGLSPAQIAEKIIAKLGVLTAANPDVNPSTPAK